MSEHATTTILVGKTAYFYLARESRKQRGCKPLSKESENKVWDRIEKKNGKAVLSDLSLGGGDGTYDGKWWPWSVDTLKKMLDKGGYKYKEGKEFKYINVTV